MSKKGQYGGRLRQGKAGTVVWRRGDISGPRELFGKVYFWSTGKSGGLELRKAHGEDGRVDAELLARMAAMN